MLRMHSSWQGWCEAVGSDVLVCACLMPLAAIPQSDYGLESKAVSATCSLPQSGPMTICSWRNPSPPKNPRSGLHVAMVHHRKRKPSRRPSKSGVHHCSRSSRPDDSISEVLRFCISRSPSLPLCVVLFPLSLSVYVCMSEGRKGLGSFVAMWWSSSNESSALGICPVRDCTNIEVHNST